MEKGREGGEGEARTARSFVQVQTEFGGYNSRIQHCSPTSTLQQGKWKPPSPPHPPPRPIEPPSPPKPCECLDAGP